jgi:hypothetical protein
VKEIASNASNTFRPIEKIKEVIRTISATALILSGRMITFAAATFFWTVIGMGAFFPLTCPDFWIPKGRVLTSFSSLRKGC